MHHLVAALPVLVGIALTMGACTSLKTKRFADDPTFPETASKIELTVHKPANVHATRKYSFTSTQQETGSAAERMMDITWDASAQLAFGYDSQRHTLVLVDHSNGRTYEISGETAVMRSALEVSEGVSEETAALVSPVTFWIHEDGRQTGHVTASWSALGSEIRFAIVVNGTPLRVEYGGSFTGERYFAFEREGRLVAFAELSYSGTRGSGEVLVKPDLVDGTEPDMLTLLVVADVVVQLLDLIT
jgi:hypothetical protein